MNTQQNSNATESQRSMALKVGNKAFLNLLSTGDASSNKLYCHAKCNNDLQNPSINIDKESSKCNIETKWRRAQAFESITSFMLEQETVEPGTTYVKNLKSFGIEEKTQATRFTGRLLPRIPNLVTSTMNKNTVVFFYDKVQQLIVNYVQSPNQFYATLQKVVHPISLDIMTQENTFTGSFSHSCQIQSILKTVLALAGELIDVEMTSSNHPSQEALSQHVL